MQYAKYTKWNKNAGLFYKYARKKAEYARNRRNKPLCDVYFHLFTCVHSIFKVYIHVYGIY